MFLSKATMRKKAESVAGRVDTANAPSDKSTEQHPLLRETKINAATKTAYLNGCVLASVLRTGKASRKTHGAVRRIGYSLQMTAEEIRESFAVVGGLSGEREKSRFVDEMLDKLKRRPVRRFFMLDVERILKVDGKISDEIGEMVDYIGTVLFGATDWRGKMAADGRRTKKKVKGKKVFRRARRNAVSVRDDDKDDKSIYPGWWEPTPVKRKGETAAQFYNRVKAMVERMERYVTHKIIRGELSKSKAKEVLLEVDCIRSDINCMMSDIDDDTVDIDDDTISARCDDEKREREKAQNKQIQAELSRIRKRYGNIHEREVAIWDTLLRKGLSDAEIEKYVDREVEAFRKKYPGLYEFGDWS